MSDRRRVGILHPGQMGAAVAATLQNGGNEVIWASEGRRSASRERAGQLGLTDVSTVERLCELCSLVVSVCPPEFADTVADQVLATAFRGIFVDANAISPDRVRRMDARLRARGVTLVDAGIIGLATMKPGTTWIYLSGDAAPEAAACFGAAPIEPKIIEGPVGQASAFKMCYAGYNKGSAALLCAILGAAQQLGVRDLLEQQWRMSDGSPANPARRLASVAPKAWRFAGEMREIAATLESAGLPPEFHQGAEEIYSRLAAFKDTVDPDLETILRVLSSQPVSEAR